MAEHGTADDATGTATASIRGDLVLTRRLLRLTYGLVPIAAGIDKYTNLLVDWSAYLPAAIAATLPVEPHLFMLAVGAVEIVAGVVVLSRYTEYGAYLVAMWLVGIAATQVVGGNYDIAVRDLVMAVGAVALAQLVVGTGAAHDVEG